MGKFASLPCIIISTVSLLVLSEVVLSDATINAVLETIDGGFKEFAKLGSDGKLNPFEYALLDLLPQFINQRPSNENGTKYEYEEYALNDDSNDDAYKMNTVELIERSGYRYELYDALSDDGYITTVTRIINPLADRTKLIWPPILLEHGGSIDPTCYLIASSIQHHPEKWPRTPEDGPMTSWNRSLAFTLANNGFDVFLAESRGANDDNKRRNSTRVIQSVFNSSNAKKNMTLMESVDEIVNSGEYWAFSQDDVIAHELKSHMDAVLKVTGSKKLSMVTISLSTPTSLAFFSIRPDYAKLVHGYVSLGPVTSGHGFNKLIEFAVKDVCPMVPEGIGYLLLTDLLFTQPVRDLLITVSRIKPMRYSLVKLVITLIFGPSAKYQTHLDLNVLGHMLRSFSFKEAKQLCQQLKSNRLQKYDYGPEKNKQLYNSSEPPVYDLTNLKLKDWIIVAGGNDGVANRQIVQNLINLVNPKPSAYINVPNFNHLDLIAGFENDIYVNLPILRYLLSVSAYSNYDGDDNFNMAASSARALDFGSIFPIGFSPAKFWARSGKDTDYHQAKNQTQDPLDPGRLMQEIQQNVQKGIDNFLQNFGNLGNLLKPPQTKHSDSSKN